MPTRKQYVDFLKSLEGGYGPARGLANNDNQFNTWYYGRRVGGDAYAWCLVTECYAQNHFDILMANGGKAAYVPDMKTRAQRAGAKVVTRPGSTKGMQPGDALAYDFNGNGSPEHTGTFVSAISLTEFYAVEGNTSTSQYSDALALRRRSVHDVLWHIELLGVGDNTPQEDDMPTYISVYKTDKSRRETVDANEWQTVYFDHNGSGGAAKHHGDGDYPSIATGPADYTGDVTLVLEGLPEGTPGQARPLYVNAKTDAVESEGQNITEFLGSAGKTYVRVPLTGYVGDGQKLRVEVTHFGAAEVKPTVTGGEVHLQVWERQ